MTFLRQINSLLSRSHRLHLLLLSVLVVFSGIMEIAGIASIMPFMGAVLNPDFITKNAHVARIYRALHYTDTNHFMIFLGMMVLLVLFVSNLLSRTEKLTDFKTGSVRFGYRKTTFFRAISR